MPNPMRSRRVLLDNPPSPYLVRDEFTDAVAAGAVNGTNATPGPGVRVTTDTGNNASVVNGRYTVAGLAGAANPLTRYAIMLDRLPGRMVRATYNIASGNTGQTLFGWGPVLGTSLDRINLAVGDIRCISGPGATVIVGSVVYDTDLHLAAVLRDRGCFFFLKGGSFANWVALWFDTGGSINPVIPAINVASGPVGFTVDSLRIPVATWLPTPLISDGFSNIFGLSDGKGHAEGVSGGVGAGGAGVTWSNSVGTWVTVDGRLQAGVMVGDQAIATVDTGTADVLGTVRMTRAAGVTSLIVRYVDADNYVRATHNGTNAQLVKRVAGVDTTLINTAATYVAGAVMHVICDGQTFRLFYNNATIGSAQTIADAALQTGTRQGVHTTSDTNSFDDFLVYARGSGGEYSILDSF